jgi:uncharacterized protein YacL
MLVTCAPINGVRSSPALRPLTKERNCLMNPNKRPVSILLLACLFATVGVVGFVRNIHAFGQQDFIWIELTEVLAVIAGIFMFLGRNWARWLALAWMSFHVILSVSVPRTFVVHLLILALIILLLFRSEARQYFRVS